MDVPNQPATEGSPPTVISERFCTTKFGFPGDLLGKVVRARFSEEAQQHRVSELASCQLTCQASLSEKFREAVKSASDTSYVHEAPPLTSKASIQDIRTLWEAADLVPQEPGVGGSIGRQPSQESSERDPNDGTHGHAFATASSDRVAQAWRDATQQLFQLGDTHQGSRGALEHASLHRRSVQPREPASPVLYVPDFLSPKRLTVPEAQPSAIAQGAQDQESIHSTDHAAASAIPSFGSTRRGNRTTDDFNNTSARLRVCSEILFSAGMNKLQQVQHLLKTHKVDVRDVYDYDFRTPLHLAASEGAFTTTEWLLSQGVDVNAVDRFGRTPLMDALIAERTLVAQKLLEANALVYEANILKAAPDSHQFKNLAKTIPGQLNHINHPDWEVTADQLELGAIIGEGDFGIVHRSLWNGTPVAVKILKSSEDIHLIDLASEIDAMLKIHHPHTVQFLGASTKAAPYLIVTELMDGASLEWALRDGVKFPLRRALEIALHCARGLNYLHLENPHVLMHRDLKPSNVMFGGYGLAMSAEELALDTGVAKLADFGLSKTLNAAQPTRAALPSVRNICFPRMRLGRETEALDEAAPEDSGSFPEEGKGPEHNCTSENDQGTFLDHFTMTGGTGSYLYMAGEVFRHEPYNAKADVYSFAMILYEMVTGRWPFQGLDVMRAAMIAATDGIRPDFGERPPSHYTEKECELLPEVQNLIQHCWHAAPMSRPTFDTIIPRLEELLASFTEPRPRYSNILAARAARSRRSHTWMRRLAQGAATNVSGSFTSPTSPRGLGAQLPAKPNADFVTAASKGLFDQTGTVLLSAEVAESSHSNASFRTRKTSCCAMM